MYNSNFNLDSFSYYEKLEELRELKLDKVLSNAFQTEIKREQQKPTVNVGTIGCVTMPSLTTLAKSIKEINNEEAGFPCVVVAARATHGIPMVINKLKTKFNL